MHPHSAQCREGRKRARAHSQLRQHARWRAFCAGLGLSPGLWTLAILSPSTTTRTRMARTSSADEDPAATPFCRPCRHSRRLWRLVVSGACIPSGADESQRKGKANPKEADRDGFAFCVYVPGHRVGPPVRPVAAGARHLNPLMILCVAPGVSTWLASASARGKGAGAVLAYCGDMSSHVLLPPVCLAALGPHARHQFLRPRPSLAVATLLLMLMPLWARRALRASSRSRSISSGSSSHRWRRTWRPE